MAGKVNGLGWTLVSVDNSAGSLKALVNDNTNIQFALPRAVQDVTGMDRSAYERIQLLSDFTCQLNGVFNADVDREHDVFSNLDNVRTLTLTAATGDSITNEVLLTDYQVTRADSGELTWQVPCVLANGTVPVWTG